LVLPPVNTHHRAGGQGMNFDFSDDQKYLRDEARRFLAAKCDTRVVRGVLEGEAPYDRDLWRAIGEMGWLGTAIPEDHGGLGLGHLELCVIAEEMGRALAPVPFASTVYLAAEALMLAGTEEQKKKWLPKIATGEVIGTLAVAEGPGAPRPQAIKTAFNGQTLKGEKLPVPDGDTADFAIVVANDGKGQGEGNIVLALVDLTAKGVARAAVKTLDPTRSQARLTFDNAPAEALGAPGEGWAQLQSVLDRAAVLIAFEQLGGADRCLEMAKEYALGRHAFGRPIGSFQAIKHKLADMYINNELARSNAYYGAWALSSGAAELPLAAAGARVMASEAYDYAAKETIQTHGGMGFTWEVDCHLFLRRAKHLGLVLGSARHWKDRLVGHLERRNVA
jgi:acyl-CoA dehydrogenase